MARRKRRLFKPLVFTSKKFRPYAMAVGEAILSWNDLHEWLGYLFWQMIGGPSQRPLGIWQALQNDRAKREILRAANSNHQKILTHREAKIAAEVDWLLTRCRELEDDRNNAIHAPISSSEYREDVGAGTGFENPRAHRLGGKDILAEYRRLRDAAVLLRDYAHDLADGLSGTLPTLPQRPRLPDRQGSKKR
jgi:hypothetical protein